jgi:hypothetical protein
MVCSGTALSFFLLNICNCMKLSLTHTLTNTNTHNFTAPKFWKLCCTWKQSFFIILPTYKRQNFLNWSLCHHICRTHLTSLPELCVHEKYCLPITNRKHIHTVVAYKVRQLCMVKCNSIHHETLWQVTSHHVRRQFCWCQTECSTVQCVRQK